MSKKKAVTEQDLQAMGLFEATPGVFKKLDPKHETVGFEIAKEPAPGESGELLQGLTDLNGNPIGAEFRRYYGTHPDGTRNGLVYNMQTYPEFDQRKFPLTKADITDGKHPENNSLPDVDLGPIATTREEIVNDLLTFGSAVTINPPTPFPNREKYIAGIDPYIQAFDGSKVSMARIDEAGQYVQINPELEFQLPPEKILEIYGQTGTMMFKATVPHRTQPFPIPEIRLLTGKKRDIAVTELHEAAKELIRDLGPTDIYIPTNVASSKNSKQLFKTGKKNQQVTRDANGNTHTKVQETSFITDSQASKAYRKQTDDSWKVNRLKFLAGLQGLKKPYRIEFTFIRTTLGKFDLHNMAQLPFDLMVDNGWLEDDESTEVIPVFNPVVYYSRHFAGIVIRVIR